MMEISKKTKNISIILIIILSAVFQLPAESIWEGSAAMGRYGEFPFTGFYGASNSFPQNAFVEVENLENGKRTRLIIVNRLSDPGLLMLVSNEAAQELGIYQNDITRIKVRMLSSGSNVEAPQYDDLAYNPDPDLNPAAALISPEEQIYSDITESRTSEEPEAAPVLEPVLETADKPVEESVAEAIAEPEITETVVEPETVETAEAEREAAATTAESGSVEAEPAAEEPLWSDEDADSREVLPESSYLTDLPPVTDSLKEAEVLIPEKEVPLDIAADSPDKPYEWPESIIPPEPEPEPEPLYLTMDELDDVNPAEEVAEASGRVHSPETEVLWPDSGTEESAGLVDAEPLVLSTEDLASAAPSAEELDEGRVLELPESTLELLSSGMNETIPEHVAEDNFRLSELPDVIDKSGDEELEYLTDSSEYYRPALTETAVETADLPVPVLEVPEEVIAILVGDHIDIAETEPETELLRAEYIDSPQLADIGDEKLLPVTELADASPLQIEDVITVSALPQLPGSDESILLEIANGYAVPGRAEFIGEIPDYPNPDEAGTPIDIPKSDDELAYASPERAEDVPGMTELPEVVSAEDSEAEPDEVDMAVPEYDESLEVTLVPAEVRPPELIEEENALAEGLPDEGTELAADIAEHSPELEAAEVVEAEAVTAPVEPSEPAETEVETTAAEVPEIEVGDAADTAVVVTVEPAEPRPPEVEIEEPAEVVVAAPAEPEPGLIIPEQVVMVSKLQQQKHYLQLGAYKEKNSAIKAAGRLEAVYPVTILTDEAAEGVSYKLLLGPLTADESGIMLYNFRAGGYSDAFIRRIE